MPAPDCAYIISEGKVQKTEASTRNIRLFMSGGKKKITYVYEQKKDQKDIFQN